MIIKSMSRKVPSFGQLISYMKRDQEDEQYQLRHNLFGRSDENIRQEFEQNAELMAKRKGGVYLYHEIISITRSSDLSPAEQKERLHEIARHYVDARCPENLVFGEIHQDKDHSYHMHLMISANQAGVVKRHRLSKAYFREIQVRLEEYVFKQYPELKQSLAIGKRSERSETQKGAELKRRTGRKEKQEAVRDRVARAFDQSHDKDSFIYALGSEDLELYVRGKTLGVTDLESGKPHRIKTLDALLLEKVERRLKSDVAERDAKVQTSASSRKTNASEDDVPGHSEPVSRDLVEIVRMAMSSATDMETFHTNLDAQGYELYVRGNAYGLQETKADGSVRRHRFSTLGLDDEFEIYLSRVSEVQSESEISATESDSATSQEAKHAPDKRAKKSKKSAKTQKGEDVKLKDMAGWAANYKDKTKPKQATKDDVRQTAEQVKEKTKEELRKEFEKLSKKQSQSQNNSNKSKL